MDKSRCPDVDQESCSEMDGGDAFDELFGGEGGDEDGDEDKKAAASKGEDFAQTIMRQQCQLAKEGLLVRTAPDKSPDAAVPASTESKGQFEKTSEEKESKEQTDTDQINSTSSRSPNDVGFEAKSEDGKEADDKKSKSKEGFKLFPKTVPVNFQDTWDFSIQELNPTYKTKTLWIEGSFYQVFVDQCLHELQHVYCPCEKKEKFTVCRLCHTSFCSNACYKGFVQKLQGKEPDSETDGSSGNNDIQEPVVTRAKITTCGTIESPPPVKDEPKNAQKYQKNKLQNPQYRHHQQHESSDAVQINPTSPTGTTQPPLQSWSNQNHDRNFGSGRTEDRSSFQFQPTSPPNNDDVRIFRHRRARDENQNPNQRNQNRYPVLVPKEMDNTNTNVPRRHSATPPEEWQHKQMNDSSTRNQQQFQRTNRNSAENPYMANPDNNSFASVPGVQYSSEWKRQNNLDLTKDFDNRPPRPHYHNRPNPNHYPSNVGNENYSNPSGRSNYQGGGMFHKTGRGGPNPNATNQPYMMENSQREARLQGNPQYFPQSPPHAGDISGGAHRMTSRNEAPNRDYSFSENFYPQEGAVGRGFQRQNRRERQKWSGSCPAFPQDEFTTSRERHSPRQRDNFGPSSPNNESINFQKQQYHNPNFSFSPNYTHGDGKYKQKKDKNERAAKWKERKMYNSNESTSSSLYKSAGAFSPGSPDSEYYSPPSTIHIGTQHSNKCLIDEDADIPFGIMTQMTHVRGCDLYDFVVMSAQEENNLKQITMVLKNCPKMKLDAIDCFEYCIVPYSFNEVRGTEQEQWFRGKVTKVLKDVGVYLLDYGVEVVVGRHAIFKIPEELLKYRPLATRFRSLNVKADMEDPEVQDYFNMLIADKTVKIKITHKVLQGSPMFAGHLYICHMGKWYDAGTLYNKLLCGEAVPFFNIDNAKLQALEVEEVITDATLPISTKAPIQAMILHAVSLNQFYVSTRETIKRKVRIEQQLSNEGVWSKCAPVNKLKDLQYPLFLYLDEGSEIPSRVQVLELENKGGQLMAVIRKIDDYSENLTVPIKILRQLPRNLLEPGCIAKCSLPVMPVAHEKCKEKKGRSAAQLSEYDQLTQYLVELQDKQVFLIVYGVENQDTHVVEVCLDKAATGCAYSFINKGWARLSRDDVDLMCLKTNVKE